MYPISLPQFKNTFALECVGATVMNPTKRNKIDTGQGGVKPVKELLEVGAVDVLKGNLDPF